MKVQKKSLGFKLITGGIIAVLLPLVVVGSFSIMKSSGAIGTISKEQAVNVARNVAGMADLILQEEIKIISQLSVNEAIVEAAAKAAGQGSAAASAEIEKTSSMLASMLKKLGDHYEELFLVDLNGTILADGTGRQTGTSLGERDYIRAARESGANVGRVIVSKTSGNLGVPVYSPVYSRDGKLVGAVTMILSIRFLAEDITSIRLGETGYAYMVDREGIVIAHPNKDFVLKLDVSKIKGMEAVARRMLAHETGVEPYVFKGIKKVSAFAPVQSTGWSVCATQNEAELLALAHSMRNFILVIGVLFMVLTVLAVLFFSRGITRPITSAVAMLNSAADQVATASSQVSSASQSLAEGSAESAAAIEETSSSLEEMASMTRQNADNAGQADGLMKEANQVVTQADQSMTELTGSMEEISKASEETSKIIKTIDEIAFQTNLLALNAAVEAARAGEAGAGFAVVADEVRSLAMRAAEAAKNTADLIEGSVKKIKGGSELVERTNTAFGEVTKSSAKVGQLVGEIAAASAEQAHGIDQLNKAITEMDKVTQQNSSNAEESASASEEMNAQAAQLKEIATQLLETIGGNGNGNGHRNGSARIKLLERPAIKALGMFPKDVAVAARKKEVRPDQMIPLEDGDFQDF